MFWPYLRVEASIWLNIAVFEIMIFSIFLDLKMNFWSFWVMKLTSAKGLGKSQIHWYHNIILAELNQIQQSKVLADANTPIYGHRQCGPLFP